MRILLSFAPLILFPFVAGFASVEAGLWVATAAALLAVVGDLSVFHRAAKLLDGGQLVLFGGLALYATLLNSLGVSWVRLVINGGMLTIVLASIAAARPFTLQYAREQTPAQLWSTPRFVSTNYRITWAWAGAFAVCVAADLARLFVPAVSHSAESAAGIAALVLAGTFTWQYPKHIRASARGGSTG